MFLEMDNSCPDLVPIVDETSDYGSRDTSDNDDFSIWGFCAVFSHIGSKGALLYRLYCHWHTIFDNSSS